MFGVNVRGTFVCSQACIPYLKQSAQAGRNPHILNLSPPLSMKPKWFGSHVAYTMAKYGMSMCVLGMSEELRQHGIGVNAVWPRTVIATAALNVISLADPKRGRKPEIMADAAHVILTRDARTCTGNFFIDDEVLTSAGVTDLDQYAVTPGNKQFQPDFFVD
jgi:citronellol/citronellal dehydrogenase